MDNENNSDNLNPRILRAALEGLLFVSNQPISYEKLSEFLNISHGDVEKLVIDRKNEIDNDSNSGLQIVINESGVQLATKACICSFIQRLDGQKLVNLSLPALETLSVIAFKQPITKAEIESLRGVNCDGVISTLLEKKLVYISGEKPVIGRPRLYSTTQDFLYYFGIKSLRELPVPAVETPTNIAPVEPTQSAEPVQAPEPIENRTQPDDHIEEDPDLYKD